MGNNIVLELETRRQAYNFISENSGLHLREISRRMNIPYSTMKYHLQYLKKRDLILEKSHGRFLRYYAKIELGNSHKKILNFLRQETPRKIILLLCIKFSPTLTEISKNLKMVYPKEIRAKIKNFTRHPSTIHAHLEKLIESGVVERIFIDKESRYILKEPEIVYDVLITHKESILDEKVKTVIWWIGVYDKNTFVPDKKFFEKYIENIFDIFPHPYHV